MGKIRRLLGRILRDSRKDLQTAPAAGNPLPIPSAGCKHQAELMTRLTAGFGQDMQTHLSKEAMIIHMVIASSFTDYYLKNMNYNRIAPVVLSFASSSFVTTGLAYISRNMRLRSSRLISGSTVSSCLVIYATNCSTSDES